MADKPPEPTPSPPSKVTVLVRRTASTLLLWAIVATALFSMRAWAYLGVIGILTVISTIEYFRMLKGAEIKGFPKFGIALCIAYCVAIDLHFLRGGIQIPPSYDGIAIFLAIAGAFTLQLLRPIVGKEPLISIAACVMGFIYVPFLFNFATRLVFIGPATSGGHVTATGSFLLLWLIAVTKFTDMGAYLTGSAIGRHKMIPHVSPGKTWEGFGGALAFSQLAGCGLYAFFPTQLAILGGWGHVIALGFILAILAVIGDLAESIVKRSLGAKDSGNMLPGIGGGLDLIDSICFTAPALYFYLQWILIPA